MLEDDVSMQIFPREILTFFKHSEGRTLLIRGKKGLGKSLFGLYLLENVSGMDDRYVYIPQGINKDMEMSYPWILEVIDRIKKKGKVEEKKEVKKKKSVDDDMNIIDFDKHKDKSARELLQSILLDLQSAQTKKKDETPQIEVLEDDMSIFREALGERGYNELKETLISFLKSEPLKTYFMMQKFDTFCSENGVDPIAALRLFRRNLAEDRKIHVIVITDRKDSTLDDYFQGIILMKDFSFGEEFVGEMELVKLGDVKIKQQKYLYNLSNRKFNLLKGIRVWE